MICLTLICNSIADSPDNIAPLADALKQRGLVTGATAGAVKFTDGTGPYKKATTLLTPVLRTLQHYPDDQGKFISALRESDLDIVIRILGKYVYWTTALMNLVP